MAGLIYQKSVLRRDVSTSAGPMLSSNEGKKGREGLLYLTVVQDGPKCCHKVPLLSAGFSELLSCYNREIEVKVCKVNIKFDDARVDNCQLS